jgi:hypothetical protein
VSIPAFLNESASVSGGYGNFSSLTTQFSISGAAGGSDSVSFGALLSAAQDLMTDAGGQVLEDEVIFNLLVNGTPVLFYDSPLTLGPSSTLSRSASPSLNGSMDLSTDPSVTNTLYIEVDAEDQVVEVETPDGGGSALMLLAVLGILAPAGIMARKAI